MTFPEETIQKALKSIATLVLKGTKYQSWELFGKMCKTLPTKIVANVLASLEEHNDK